MFEADTYAQPINQAAVQRFGVWVDDTGTCRLGLGLRQHAGWQVKTRAQHV